VITGLVPELVEGGLTHLQYADDTILFIENNSKNLSRVKFLLFCFEEMSGLRINYNKSEVFGVCLEEQEQLEIAQMLNCRVGTFPMKYLGIPVSDTKLTKSDLNVVAEKIENRLATRKCGQLSYGGRAVLLNSCLTSIPMYVMGFYLLYEGNHQRMDAARARFFWQGTGKKKKYHMIRWEALSTPKEFGGLGFLDTRAMNTALLAKWLSGLSVENLVCVSIC